MQAEGDAITAARRLRVCYEDICHRVTTAHVLCQEATAADRVRAPDLAQSSQRVGIDEVVRHSDRPDDVASKDPELRMWDALDASTHAGTMQDAMADHLQACRPSRYRRNYVSPRQTAG